MGERRSVIDGGGEGALWAEFSAPLRAFVRKRVPPALDADDVLQEIFLRIARHRESLAELERVDAWIYQIARTAVADALRAHRRREAHVGDVSADELPDLGQDAAPAVIRELTPCLAPFAQRLEEPYRSALALTDLGGMSQTEAARQLGISVSGMKSRVQRARQQLRDSMLRCCRIDVDARGAPMDYEVRDASACGPAGALEAAADCGSDGCAPSLHPLERPNSQSVRPIA